jgi:hypothetical protein
LRTEVLDLVMLHWPIPEEDVEEGWTALAELRGEGKIRFIGVSNFNGDLMAQCESIAGVETVQPEYSLVDRRAEAAVFPYAEQHNVGVIVYSPLKHGMLSGAMSRERVEALVPGDWRRDHPEYREPRLTRNLRLAASVRAVAFRAGQARQAIWTRSGSGWHRPLTIGATRMLPVTVLTSAHRCRTVVTSYREGNRLGSSRSGDVSPRTAHGPWCPADPNAAHPAESYRPRRRRRLRDGVTHATRVSP